MARKTIDEVRREVDHWKAKWREEHKRAEAALQQVIVQRARAEAYESALSAVLADVKRLGLILGPTTSKTGA